ncbi:hypothetical protein ACLOAV_010177 [Pseudogymnoascus australis]
MKPEALRYMIELPSSYRATLLSLESYSTIREYEPVYALLNPSQPTSPSSQSVIEVAPEDVSNCFDNDGDIFPPSDPSPTHNSTLDGNSNVDQSIEQPASLVNTNVKDLSDEITGNGEGILSRPQQDGNASGQEEGDSDFEFVAEDVETDSNSETDLSPDEETAGIEVSIEDIIQTNSSVAKDFLENTWSRLCDCEKEENPQNRTESVYSTLSRWLSTGRGLACQMQLILQHSHPRLAKKRDTSTVWDPTVAELGYNASIAFWLESPNLSVHQPYSCHLWVL